MQLYCSEKDGKPITTKLPYCAYHRYRTLNYNHMVSPLSLSTVSLTKYSFVKHKNVFIWNSSRALFSFHLNDVYLSCRTPSPESAVIVQTPHGKSQSKKKVGSRLISSKRIKVQDTPPVDNTEHDPFSAARCRIFLRTNHTKKVTWRLFLFLLVNVCSIRIDLCFKLVSYSVYKDWFKT